MLPPAEQGPSDCLTHRLVDDSLLLSLGPDSLLHLLEVGPPSVTPLSLLAARALHPAHAPEQMPAPLVDEHTLAPAVPRFWTRNLSRG